GGSRGEVAVIRDRHKGAQRGESGPSHSLIQSKAPLKFKQLIHPATGVHLPAVTLRHKGDIHARRSRVLSHGAFDQVSDEISTLLLLCGHRLNMSIGRGYRRSILPARDKSRICHWRASAYSHA